MKNRIACLLAAGLLGGASVAHAALAPTFSFNVSDSWIEVGEMFDVEVDLTGVDASFGNLTGFGFVVDPSSSLTKFAFQGATVGSSFFDLSDTLTPGDVAGGLADPSTGSDIHLATLSFLALDVGSETLDLTGMLTDFRGLFFATPDFSVFTDFDVQTSVQLSSVPEPSTYGLFGVGLLLGVVAWRKRNARRAPARA